jgi:hypothetical protein
VEELPVFIHLKQSAQPTLSFLYKQIYPCNNIFVKSQKAAERVMATVGQYIEKKLKLKVNREKSTNSRRFRRSSSI